MQKFKYDLTQLLKKIIHRNDQIAYLKQLINIQDNIRRKVIKNEIVTLDEFIDVYDITVPPNNNFVLNNVFVHNSAKSARDSSFQAIMPLRGKILNTEKVDFDKAMTSDTAKAFIASIGTGIGKNFDINKCRYDKIIMMCDADIDGLHISNLILTLIYNYMRPLLSEGYVYNTIPPLYKVIEKKKQFYFKYIKGLVFYKN